MIREVSTASFETDVVQSDKAVLVDFWGPRCAPCLALMPEVEALAQKYGEQLEVAKIDASKNRRLCLRLKVLGLPTFLFYRDGQELKRLTGGDLAINDIESLAQELILGPKSEGVG